MQNNRGVIKLGRRRVSTSQFFPSVLGFNCLTLLLRFPPLRWVFIIYSQIITFLLNERNGLLVFNFPFFIIMLATLVIKSQIAWWSHQGFTSIRRLNERGSLCEFSENGCGARSMSPLTESSISFSRLATEWKACTERWSASGACSPERNSFQNRISIWNEMPIIGLRLWIIGN